MKSTNALLIHPKFNNSSFWNYKSSCRLVGASYPAPPLGLITIAAMLPDHWQIKVVDRNVNELSDGDIAWADLIMMGGMMPQQLDMLLIIRLAHENSVPIVLGGPAMTSEPALYKHADIMILGEAEGAMDEFIAAWNRGERTGIFKAPLHSVDVTKTPVPRFDLINFSDYLMINVQFSRGCPFLCEFCDIIELFGRRPRTKDTPQMLAELDTIYKLGHRGHVDFVDDNLIGNKKAVKAFLPHLIEWQKERNYPFLFSTEASLNMADDEGFLALMRDAGFFAVFIGIESPDPDVLAATQKKQNMKRDIAQSINRIQAYGMFVVAGFIVGFDNEGDRVADGLIELIEEASIPIAMVGLMYALPNTQLTRRLQAEGRLHDPFGYDVEASDQCTAGINFTPTRPRMDILNDYLKVVEHLFDQKNYFNRIKRTVDLLHLNGPADGSTKATFKHDTGQLFKILWGVTWHSPEMRFAVWSLLVYVLLRKPKALKHALYMATIYDHLGPFSRFVSKKIHQRIEEIEADPDYEENCKKIAPGFQLGKEADINAPSPLMMPNSHLPAAE